MKRYLFLVDNISAWVGKLFGWTILLLVLIVAYDVFMRKVLSAPTRWAFDASYMLYGTLIMMAGAYTLSRNGHVRGDMFYRGWSVRTQARVDLLLYVLFFFPGVIALVWSGWQFAEVSRAVNERSFSTPGGPIIWPFKFIIPLAGFFMLAQGVVEVIRILQAMRTGVWPERLSDVEETETRLAKESQL